MVEEISVLTADDYIAPGLAIVTPDAAFPNMVLGDKSAPDWRYFRRWVDHAWYVDQRNPHIGFANRDEASILYNSALLFAGKPCLEVGCWRGWSAAHLALGGVKLDVIDPMFADQIFAASVSDSLRAAGVADRITLYNGASPGAVHTLAGIAKQPWSLIFIDGDHEGDAPRQDALAAMNYAAETAMVLFHDLASPYVAAGLHAMRDAGWRTMVYQTMQIMGVAWRGEVTPVAHIPDPRIFWTLPRHLDGYAVSGWKQPAPIHNPRRPEEKTNAALQRAQRAEDDCQAALFERQAALNHIARLQAELAAATATFP